MPSQLVSAHIEAERRLRAVVTQQVARIWAALAGYDREDVDPWLSQVLPLVAAAQRASATLTDAYLARALDRRPTGIDYEQVIGAAVRAGTSPETVYERPFITTWTGLKDGKLFEDAYEDGLNRATTAAATDVQLTMRATASAFQDATPGFYGFARRADPGACEFCRLVDGAYVKRANAFPLHPHCGCSLEPLTAPHPAAAKLPNGVAVHQHGEMGATLADPSHDFTTKAEIPAI